MRMDRLQVNLDSLRLSRTGYSAKYSPPKKVTKEKKDLSENIKRFLAKREEEERQKALEKHQKAQELMARRGGKGKKKIEKMLKVIKSANKSVLEDAADAAECALGTESLEDDYGYTSALPVDCRLRSRSPCNVIVVVCRNYLL